MTLAEQQHLFLPLVAKLVTKAYELGYQLSAGELWRPPEMAALNAKMGKGIANSLHCDRLAIDLLLFKDGVYLTDSAAYEPLGVYWESLHPLAAWGGRFSKPDGDHFSLAFGGRK